MKKHLDKKREEFKRRLGEGNNTTRAKASQFKEGLVPHDPEALACKIKTQLQDIVKKPLKKMIRLSHLELILVLFHGKKVMVHLEHTLMISSNSR